MLCLKILFNRLSPGETSNLRASTLLPLLQIKHRPERFRNSCCRRKRRQLDRAICSCQSDGTVRSAEVDSERGAGEVRRRHGSLDCQIFWTTQSHVLPSLPLHCCSGELG